MFGCAWEVYRSWALHFAAWVPFVIEWIILLSQYIVTSLWSSSPVPTFLHLLVPCQLIMFVLFGMVQLCQQLRCPLFKDYTTVELAYLVLSLAAKAIMACVVLIAILSI